MGFSQKLRRHGKTWHNPLRVYGKYVLDSAYNKVMLRGFGLRRTNFSQWDGGTQYLPLTIERFRQLRFWGFNVVRSLGYWGRDYEPNENEPRVYREQFLSDLEAAIQRAEKAGLYWIVAPRVSFDDVSPPTWQGWGRHYHLLDATYRARYCDMLKMLVDRYDKYWNVMFCPWHFPWHGTSISDGDRATFYSVVAPQIVNAIRSKTDKIVFFTPVHGGHLTIDGTSWETGAYNYINPLGDKNVVYGFESYKDHNTYNVSHQGTTWDYDEADLETHLSYGVNFMNTHDVPFDVMEFGMDVHSDTGLCDQRPINQSRLDWLRTKVRLFDKYGIHWTTYWILSSGSSTREYFSVFETVETYGEMPVFGLIQALQRQDRIPHIPPLMRDQIEVPLFSPRVGNWFDLGAPRSTGTTRTDFVANGLHAHLIWVPRRMRFNRIGIYVPSGGAGGAGASARLGVYNVDPRTYYPTTLVLDAGTVDCSTTGAKELTINLTLDRGWYALAIVTNDATIDLRFSEYGLSPLGRASLDGDFNYQAWRVSYTYGALPSTYPAGAGGQIDRIVMLRLAELL